MASVTISGIQEDVISLLRSVGLDPYLFRIVPNDAAGRCEVFGPEDLIARLRAILSEHQ